MAIELKSFVDNHQYKQSIQQAANYGKSLTMSEIHIIFFVEARMTDELRKKYEGIRVDQKTGVRVVPIFIEVVDC